MTRKLNTKAALQVEALEARNMPAGLSVSLVGSVLQVVGTTGADNISIMQKSGRLQVAGVTGSFDATRVSRIDVYGQGGNDTITLDPMTDPYATPITIPSRIYAGNGRNTITGGAGNDYISTGSGADQVSGMNGNDTIVSTGGNDTISGGWGNDSITCGAGNDSLDGGGDNDSIWGGAGNDTLFGGTENDVLVGGDGNDVMDGGLGNDAMWSEAGNDTMNGGSGNDTLWGGTGSDELYGHFGNDFVFGEAGNDLLLGGPDSDVLSGGAGNDVLADGLGRNLMLGGSGRDDLQMGQDDILHGGTSAYETNVAALDALMKEWGRTDLNLTGRLNHLNNGGGLNGQVTLSGSTFFDDGETDLLAGINGRTVWINPGSDRGGDRYLTGNVAPSYGRTPATANVLLGVWSGLDYANGQDANSAGAFLLNVEYVTSYSFHAIFNNLYNVDGTWDAATQTIRFTVNLPGGTRSYAARVQLDASGRWVMANLAPQVAGTVPVWHAVRQQVS